MGACHVSVALEWNLWQSPRVVEMRVASGRLCVAYTVSHAAGDVNSIKIGENSNIQDNVVVHVAKHNAQDRALPTIIGNNVTIGVLHASLVVTHNTAAANKSNQKSAQHSGQQLHRVVRWWSMSLAYHACSVDHSCICVQAGRQCPARIICQFCACAAAYTSRGSYASL